MIPNKLYLASSTAAPINFSAPTRRRNYDTLCYIKINNYYIVMYFVSLSPPAPRPCCRPPRPRPSTPSIAPLRSPPPTEPVPPPPPPLLLDPQLLLVGLKDERGSMSFYYLKYKTDNKRYLPRVHLPHPPSPSSSHPFFASAIAPSPLLILVLGRGRRR